jgi:Holliday junction DNA helicase RuvA
MITYIKGKLAKKDPTHVVIEANGIGYHVKISLSTYSALKNEELIKLHTFLHIKEDAHTLYGFAEESEKSIFLQLISVSGIGPGTGLMFLSSLSAVEIENAILAEDVKTIQGVKGVGLKTAQRVILELKDKIKKNATGTEPVAGAIVSSNKIRQEALTALQTLGFTKINAEKSIDYILHNKGKDLSLEELIRLALRMA